VVYQISLELLHAFDLQTPVTAECSMRHSLGNGRYPGNHIMDMPGTWWDATTEVSFKSVHWEASYGISNIFQHGGRCNMARVRHFEFKKKINIWSRDCHVGPNLLECTKFHQNWFTRWPSRRPWLQNVQCAVAKQQTLPRQPHDGGYVGNVIVCEHPSFVQIGRLVGELWHSQYFPSWRPSTILNFKKN